MYHASRANYLESVLYTLCSLKYDNVQVCLLINFEPRKKFVKNLLKVHINRIQLYLNSTSPRIQYKLKP